MATSVFINYKNRKITIKELSEISGEKISTIAARRRRHRDATGEEILDMSRCRMLTDKNGITKSIKDWADEKACSPDWFRATLKTNTIDEVLLMKPKKTKLSGIKRKNLDNTDISDCEYNPLTHLTNLYNEGLSFFDIHRRLVSAGMFDELI